MKIWFKYVLFFSVGFFLFAALMGMSQSPEARIEGEWKELAWEYEKVNRNDTVKSDFTGVSSYVKDIAGLDLVIHNAEKWKFCPDGKLILQGAGYTREIDWVLKGRGNVLELKYGNNIEHYNLTELSDDKLVLNFDTNTNARGIARLTFEKI